MIENRTYIGIVEDNADPKRLGRCRIRVFDVFDDIPVEDIPWASPWKDLNGNQFNLPEKGKVLTVIFDSGNIYKPEYIYSDHFNVNLEQKLKKISDPSYLSMKSLIFDHKTQIYSNDDEGLMIDYMFNHVNITKDNIDISLKDNFGRINVGDKTSDQEAVLGTNFLGWFDEFVDNLLGSKAGPYLGNLGAPVVANPDFISVLLKYKALKQPKFLSRNVFLNSNYQITTVRQNEEKRENKSQLGDSWRSTKFDNDLSYNESNPPYKPEYGTGDEVPPISESTGLSTDGQGNSPVFPEDSKIVGENNPDVDVILEAMKSKKYVIKEDVDYINIVGIRYQLEGNQYSNVFKDRMWAIWKNSSGNWESKSYPVSTIAGLYRGSPKNGVKMKKYVQQKNPKGLGTIVPSQYINIYSLHEASSSTGFATLPYLRQSGPLKAFRDKHWDDDRIYYDNKNNIDVGNFGMHIHKGFLGGTLVNSWSEGCQVFSKSNDYSQFISLLRTHIKKYGNRFNYTLMTHLDIS